MRRVLVALPRYLEEHGAPRVPLDLRDHRCILYCNGEKVYDEWTFTGPSGPERVTVRGQLHLSGGLPMLQAAVAGAGILHVDRLVLADEIERGELVPILPGYTPAPGFPLHALYVGPGLMPRKTKAFLDAIRGKLKRSGATGPVL